MAVGEEVGTGYISVGPNLDGFASKLKAKLAGELRGIDAPIQQAGKRAGQGFGDKLHEGIKSKLAGIGAMLKTGLLVGVAGVAAGLGGLTVFGLKAAAALEQTNIGIEALVGNAQDAKKFVGELQQFAAKTPFEFAGVADASRRILAFGQSVGITRDQVIPTLTTIGDLVSVLGGTQENIDSVIRALGQMASKGKVSQEEVLQLAEALPGFNANAAIASSLGLSVADTLKLITAGGVDAKTGIDALLKGMQNFNGAAGAMEKQSQTLLGVFSTFKDTISIALTNAFQPVIPQLKQSLTDITPLLGSAIGQLAPMLGKLLATALPLLASVIQAIVPIITPVLDALQQTVMALTPALQPLGDALGQIAAAVAPLLPVLGDVLAKVILALVPALVELAPSLVQLAPALGDILIALVPLLPPLSELLVLVIKMVAPLINLLALWDTWATSHILVPVIEGIAFALGKLYAVVRPMVDAWDSLDKAGGHFKDLGRGIGGVFSAIGTFFHDLPGNIAQFFQNLPGMVLQGLEKVAFAVGFGIGTLIRLWLEMPPKIIAAVQELPGLVGRLFSDAFDRAKQFAGDAFSWIVARARELPGKVAEFVTGLPGMIRDAVATIRQKLIDIGSSIIDGIKQGVINAAMGLVHAVLDVVNQALSGAKSALGIASPSKVFAELGEQTVAGYVKGIEDSARSAQAAQAAMVTPAANLASSGAVAPAPQVVTVGSSDPVISAVIDHIRDKVRSQFGGDVVVAFGSAA